VTKQELNLLQLAACGSTKPGAAMPNPGLCRIHARDVRLALSC
jgi:hypothetical protein